MGGGKGGAEAFLALGVDARGDGLKVFDCLEETEVLGEGENTAWLYG